MVFNQLINRLVVTVVLNHLVYWIGPVHPVVEAATLAALAISLASFNLASKVFIHQKNT